MKRYETFVIVDPDVPEEDRNQFLDRLKEVVSDQQGLMVLIDEWGSRKLAYEIKKKSRGYYVRLDYCGTGALVDELERLFRIDDRIMKYMTVLLSDSVDIEKIQEEIAKAEAEAALAAAQIEKPAEEPVTPDTPETEREEPPQEEPVASDAPDAETEVPAEIQPETKTEESE